MVSLRGPFLALAALAAQLSIAQQGPPSPLRGSVSIGVRGVDTSGAESKYREDINLDDGARLFDLSLHYVPAADDGSGIDELNFDASNLGGDPFETIHFGVRKYGAYQLKLDRRRSAYFYEDTILPVALANANASNGGDFHRFDFERVRDTALLDINLSPATRLNFGLEHQTRTGDSSTTLGIQRDEFELDKPLDESLDVLRVGLQHQFEHVTLILEESIADFANSSEVFVPGATPGQSAANPAELQFFMLDQQYDYGSRNHLVRVLANPTDRLNVQAMLRRESLDLDLSASERANGLDFNGLPFIINDAGNAATGRDLDIAQIDFGLRIGERARLVGTMRSSNLDQSGTLAFGLDQGAGEWTIDTQGIELGAEFQLRPRLLIAGGWSVESRDTSLGWQLNTNSVAESLKTDRDGYFARLLYRRDNGLEVTASIEDNSIDDPFTLSSPTDSRRYKASMKRAWSSGLSLTGTYRRTDVANDTSAWAADTTQADLRLGYRHARLNVSSGIGTVDVARDILQTVTGGTRQDTFAIAYAADSTFLDAAIRWTINDRFSLGGQVRDYTNRGSFRLDRQDLRAELGYRLTDDYLLELRYRAIDYTEDSFDSYDAKLIEVGVRLDWN